MSERLSIQQALFGYRDGHNLMASSVPFSPQTRHFLATVTDGSGSEATEGFRIAYTGLPVPETDYYALFCTWPAPEMPRPGCFWSHVLLIDLTDLARIPSLNVLRQLCQRPDVTKNLSGYEKSLALNISDATSPFRPDDCTRAAHILPALYEQPGKGIVVLDQNGCLWEAAIFELWSQQWPKLRRNFAFSTGSLGDRRLAGVPFDLQVAPTSSQRLWPRGGTTVVVEMTPETVTASTPPWVSNVLCDLGAGAGSPLRRFLFDYGSDVEKPRHAFAQLATAYNLLYVDPGSDWTAKLRFISEAFPNKSEALRLKESLVTPNVATGSVQELERVWATASFLLSAREAKAYARVSFDHAKLAPFLWERKKENVLSLLGQLVRQQENPAATAFAAAIANAVEPSELKLILDQKPELISILLSLRPALAFDVNAWLLPEHTQWQIAEALDKLTLSQKDWGEIMAAKFFAATYVGVRETVEKAGPYAIQGAFRWLNNSLAQEYLPSQLWRQALAGPAIDRLHNPELLPPASLALCAWFVPPETIRQLLTASRKDVQQLAQQPLDTLPQPLRLPTAFLLVTLGLRATGPIGVRLLKQGYFEVYAALAASTVSNIKFPWESWLLLSAELPQPGMWRDWDRCERLRRAVRQWLSQNIQVGNPLLDMATNKEQSEIARQTLAGDGDSDHFID